MKKDKINSSLTNPIQDIQPAPLSSVCVNKNVSFKARITDDIEHKEYMKLTEEEKDVYRRKHADFFKLINIS